MKQIGVRELKSRLNSIVRIVVEEQVQYTVTVYGKPVATLSPITDEDRDGDRIAVIEQELATIDELAAAIGRSWTSRKRPLALLEDLREETACRS